jgi:crystallin alpha B
VTTKGHELLIEGHHEEKSDEHGQIERHFVRKYVLPKGAQVDAVVSHLSRDGHLTISAPKSAIDGPSMRNIAIQPAPEQQRKAVEGSK